MEWMYGGVLQWQDIVAIYVVVFGAVLTARKF